MILSLSHQRPFIPTLAGFLFAAASSAAALALRFGLDDVLPPGFPFLTFFPAVIVTAFFGGVRAGTLCALLCGVAAWYWFIPGDGFSLDLPGALALAFYVFIVAVDILLISAMNAAMRRLEAAKRHSAALADQQGTMFEELQHRVANNLAFIASLLNMSRRRIVKEPQTAPDVIDEARARIEMMARIHRRLHDPNSVDVPVGSFLDELCADIVGIAGTKTVSVSVAAPPMTLDIRKLTTVSMFVSEVVTNSLKHAFPGERPGQIAITLERRDGDLLALSIADNGVGLDPSRETPAGNGLGLRIIGALATQLKGELQVESAAGVTTRLVFPA